MADLSYAEVTKLVQKQKRVAKIRFVTARIASVSVDIGLALAIGYCVAMWQANDYAGAAAAGLSLIWLSKK